jgi:acyl CoA:acetate/3-ketoacid CoA transferase beta subunit
MSEHRIEELMVCRIAADVEDDGITVLGSFTPLAYAAYMLAKLTTAPSATLIGFNAIGMPPVQLNLTGTEAAAYRGAVARWTFSQSTQTVHLGRRGLVECISPAQIDGSGAFNVSVIGEHARPKVRLPGGAGSPEVVQHYRRILLYVGTHDTRTLVERVDFRTGQRRPLDDAAREAAGLLPGPVRVITPLAVLRKDHAERPFAIETLHRGVSADEVVQRTGFALEVPADIPTTAEPTSAQLALLRERIDPWGTIRFDFMSARDRRAYLRELLDGEWRRARASGSGAKIIPFNGPA